MVNCQITVTMCRGLASMNIVHCTMFCCLSLVYFIFINRNGCLQQGCCYPSKPQIIWTMKTLTLTIDILIQSLFTYFSVLLCLWEITNPPLSTQRHIINHHHLFQLSPSSSSSVSSSSSSSSSSLKFCKRKLRNQKLRPLLSASLTRPTSKSTQDHMFSPSLKPAGEKVKQITFPCFFFYFLR